MQQFGSGIKTVAEGIEEAHQLVKLRTGHCDMGQGYFFARPLAKDAAHDLLLEEISQPDRPSAWQRRDATTAMR